MAYRYAYQGEEEGRAKAVSTNLSISTKSAIMLANFVRGKSVTRARRDLQNVIDKRTAVPFTRFTEGAGHKPGKIGAGKYPFKGAKAFLAVINSAAANAEDKGLGDELVICSVTAQQGMRSMRYGRHVGRERKSTHVEVVVQEVVGKKPAPKKATPKPATKAEAKPAPKKTAAKPAEKKEAPKAEAKSAPKKAVEKAPAKTTPQAESKPAPKETPKEVKETKDTEVKDGN